MLDAAREAVSFIAGKNRQDLDANRMLTLSLVKDVEILGEAASKVSEEGKRLCPDMPWRDIIAMRNPLIHGYFDVDLNIVWQTVTDELPPIIQQLEKSLKTQA
jgi:uncharacterized protein with HEPN domain